MVVFPIPSVITLVKVEADSKSDFGTNGAFPITICTASASPKARAIPNTIPVIMAGKVVGIITREIVCHRVAPSA
ncbi:hypothetical protein D3C75_526020 [compost metagenome]